MVAYRCRYEPSTKSPFGSRAPANSDQPGHSRKQRWRVTDPNQWRLKKDLAGGGSMMDIGIYALQAARYLSGEEPTEVNALIYTTPNDPRFTEVEENINFQLRFPSGILAKLYIQLCYDSQSYYRVVGTKGWLEMEPATVYRGCDEGSSRRRYRGTKSART